MVTWLVNDLKWLWEEVSFASFYLLSKLVPGGSQKRLRSGLFLWAEKGSEVLLVAGYNSEILHLSQSFVYILN